MPILNKYRNVTVSGPNFILYDSIISEILARGKFAKTYNYSEAKNELYIAGIFDTNGENAIVYRDRDSISFKFANENQSVNYQEFSFFESYNKRYMDVGLTRALVDRSRITAWTVATTALLPLKLNSAAPSPIPSPILGELLPDGWTIFANRNITGLYAVPNAYDGVTYHTIRTSLHPYMFALYTPWGLQFDSFTASAGQTEFIYTFSILQNHLVEVKKNDVILDLTTDYTVDLGLSKVTLNVPATLGDSIVLTKKNSGSIVAMHALNTGAIKIEKFNMAVDDSTPPTFNSNLYNALVPGDYYDGQIDNSRKIAYYSAALDKIVFWDNSFASPVTLYQIFTIDSSGTLEYYPVPFKVGSLVEYNSKIFISRFTVSTPSNLYAAPNLPDLTTNPPVVVPGVSLPFGVLDMIVHNNTIFIASAFPDGPNTQYIYKYTE